MVKLLIGGPPCTFWSIAQKNGREVAAEGLGWELFKNYLDEYLVLLTADTVKETAFSDFTIAACEALMTARGQ